MQKEFVIDEITWNDLNLEEVYRRMNVCASSVGEESLKHTLKTLCFDEAALQKRDAKAEAFRNDPALRSSFQKIFQVLGKTRKVSFLDYIFRLKELKPYSSFRHIILIVLLLAAVALIFINPVVGIIALVVMIAVNIIFYFRFRSEVEGYFNCLKYLVSMVIAANSLTHVRSGEVFAEDMDVLKQETKTFAALKRGSWLITNSVSGSLIDVILDYIRMIFHVDLIKFNSMRKHAVEKEEDIKRLYDTLGELETCMCIAAFRDGKPDFCKPVFSAETPFTLDASALYHPLIDGPVKNDIHAEHSVLLTGSNASGKSTFLKTVAINQIFAQTIYTCLADSFHTSFCKVLSSMALTDNLLGNESYFIVEIKSLKRIFDAIEEEVPVLGFVDEVLRGTNTAERIAASGQILKKLAHENALIFAATHDLELTQILADDMDNYHFTETIEENGDIKFDYCLKQGPAVSRNAIKLLKAYGFAPEIVSAAEKMADELVHPL